MRLRLKELRENHDKTQKEVAEYLKCKQQTYSNYESGKVRPSLALLVQLALYYDTSLDYLLDITDDSTPHMRSKG